MPINIINKNHKINTQCLSSYHTAFNLQVFCNCKLNLLVTKQV